MPARGTLGAGAWREAAGWWPRNLGWRVTRSRAGGCSMRSRLEVVRRAARAGSGDERPRALRRERRPALPGIVRDEPGFATTRLDDSPHRPSPIACTPRRCAIDDPRPGWSTDPRLGASLIAALPQVHPTDDRLTPKRLWWLKLADDATVVDAGPLTTRGEPRSTGRGAVPERACCPRRPARPGIPEPASDVGFVGTPPGHGADRPEAGDPDGPYHRRPAC